MKKDKLPSIVSLLILSLITATFWVIFSVYRAFTKPATVDVTADVLESLNPNLDANALGNLEKRFFLEEGEIQSPVVITTQEATSTPTPFSESSEETASSSATPEVSPTASP